MSEEARLWREIADLRRRLSDLEAAEHIHTHAVLPIVAPDRFRINTDGIYVEGNANREFKTLSFVPDIDTDPGGLTKEGGIDFTGDHEMRMWTEPDAYEAYLTLEARSDEALPHPHWQMSMYASVAGGWSYWDVTEGLHTGGGTTYWPRIQCWNDGVDSETTFNMNGRDIDLRVEAVGEDEALFVEGSTGNVGVGTDTPTAKLDVAGVFALSAASCGKLELCCRKDLADATPTSVVRITTTNETGDTDAGHWAAFVFAIPFAGRGTSTATAASKAWFGAFSRSMEKTGTGVDSAVTESIETASAATTPASRDVAAVTVTSLEVDEYNVDIQVSVTKSGALTANNGVMLYVVLCWTGFATAPTMAAV